ncbi:hypothetical protein M404DRAFT_29234 [Pisolithus tinctorius Marx 270]|uniref:Uncharacterized protein n=1 Tax=Pisolithus tinctorius Marx 270 TaxID=870435 RepID=A0A0C3IVJ6_PISTI|nr:hypothetical protein M404DRAFT_29234 [Pisolithus tinctorius Marx 270]
MSTNCAPRLSQLVCVATPNPIEAEKASLREKFVAASAALVAEAKCLPDDKEELWEEKVMWMRRWEQRTGEVFPLVERRQALGIDTKIDAADGPTVAEADEAYERWVSEEIVQGRADEDVRMEEEALQVVKEQGNSNSFPTPVRKQSQQTIVESEDEDEPKIIIPPGSILHKHSPQRLQRLAPPRGATDDNNNDNEVEVVESHMHVKGKAPVHSWLDPKVTADLLQSLRLLHAEATELHTAYL